MLDTYVQFEEEVVGGPHPREKKRISCRAMRKRFSRGHRKGPIASSSVVGLEGRTSTTVLYRTKSIERTELSQRVLENCSCPRTLQEHRACVSRRRYEVREIRVP